MKKVLWLLIGMLLHLIAVAHGNSNIEGYFEINPSGEVGISIFSLHLRELEPNALQNVEVSMRIGQSFTNPLVSLEKIGEGHYTARLGLQGGQYNLRIYLKGANRDEIGMGGFVWENGKAIVHSNETEVWFVPRGKYDPIPWADHISGVVVGVVALVLCLFILFKPKQAVQNSSKKHKNWVLFIAAIASLSMPLGAYWDISVHSVSGRESFFQAPHLMIYGGILLCMVIIAVAIGWKPRSVTWKDHLRKDKYAFGALVALVIQLSSGPFDELWHSTFGLDVSVWSPPHVILIFGGVAVCLYLSLLQTRESTVMISILRFLIIAGALLIVNVFLAEFEFPMPAWHISQQRPGWVFPCLMILFTIIGAHAAQRSTHLRFSASITIVAFVGLRLLVSAFLIVLGQSVLPTLSWWQFLLPLIGVGMDLTNHGKNNAGSS